MSNIQINDIGNHGLDLFEDNESFMSDLQTEDLGGIHGGLYPDLVGPAIVFTPRFSLFCTITKTVTSGGPISISPIEL
jgi:hypothetical protein